MRLRLYTALILLASLLGGTAQELHYRLWFTDKGQSDYSLDRPDEFLSPRAVAQREKWGIAIDSTDLPIPATRLQQLSQLGGRILAVSKWLNTATVALADTTPLRAIERLPFVARYDFLGSPVQTGHIVRPRQKQIEDTVNSPYGDAGWQIALHNGDKLHQAGFTGEGMTIAVIDGGFLNADNNPRFAPDRIAGYHDFIDEEMDFRNGNSHGSAVLSTMLTNDSSLFIGTAPQALYWLLRSENTAAEYPAEEDYWATALEYADSLGVDVVTSSLGYTRFDNSRFDHSWPELDGRTAYISQAAARGVQKGLLIVVSAGNEGSNDWQKINFPGDVDGLLTVGAVTTERARAYFSGVGPTADNRVKPDVVALGAATATIDPEGNLLPKDGTSFSAPIIAGLTACLRQALPHLSAREIIALIHQNSTRYLDPDSLLGYGIPDFYAAYRQGSDIETPRTGNAPLQLSYREGNPIVTVGSLPPDESGITLRVYSLEGTVLAQYRLPEGAQLELNDLNKGTYLLSARGRLHCWTQKIQRL